MLRLSWLFSFPSSMRVSLFVSITRLVLRGVFLAIFGMATMPMYAQQSAMRALQPMQIKDDRGVTVHFAQPPQRIISLLPSLTEMVCALEACDRLVGVDPYANWPRSVQRLPKVGGLEDTQIERIVALAPDVVLVAVSSRASARLSALGLKVVALEPQTLADVQRVLNQLSTLLGLPPTRARQLWQRIDNQLTQTAKEMPLAFQGTRVYFEVGSGPYAAGEASFIGQIMARLGIRNIVPQSLGTFPKINPEWVVRGDPQVIMTSEHNAEDLKTRPGWSRIRAVRDQRICAFNAAQGDILARPGPRMAEAAILIRDCLRGRLGK